MRKRQMKVLDKLAERLRKSTASYGFSCVCCGGELFTYPYEKVCESCVEELPCNDGHTCQKCGRKTHTDGVCLSCKATLPNFTYGVSAFCYQGTSASLVNRFKNGQRYLAYYFAERMTITLLQRFPRLKELFDRGMYETKKEELLVMPVPLTKESERIRGYNQAEELAKALVEELQNAGVSATGDYQTLVKTRECTVQKYLGYLDRLSNVTGAYHVHKRTLCKDKIILLVDDIMTTGATGSECARVLKNAGAKDVYFISVASLNEGR